MFRTRFSIRPQASLLLLLGLGSAALSCDQDVDTIYVARCASDDACEAGHICVDGACVPYDALSCTEVQGGQAILQPTPTLLDFGYVGSGTAQGELLLRNIGDCSLTLFDASFAMESASPFVCPGCAQENFPLELFPFREHRLRFLFTPSGVGDFVDELVLLSDDAEYPEIRVPVRARFDGVPVGSVAPTALDFGYAPVGRSVTKTVQITNQGSGNAPLEILEVRVESSTVSTFTVTPELVDPVSLLPVRSTMSGSTPQTHDLTVQYKPAEIDAHTGTLVILTNAASEPTLRVPLQGSSQTPAKISINPGSVRFGPVPIGQSTSLPVTIINEGGSPLHVTPSWGGAGPSDFSVQPAVIAAVAPGSFTEMQVFVTATAPGALTGILVLETNDPTQPRVTIQVSADGQDVVGAQVVKIEMSFENGSDSALDDDFRNVDMSLESPFGLICNKQMPNPTNWGNFGNPSWLAFGPKEEPERIVLPDAMQDGTYRVLLNYVEDCSSIPSGLLASVLGISIEVLINAITGGVVGPGADDISGAIDDFCFNHSGSSATLTFYVNGQIIAEVPARLSSKGELLYAADLIRSNGTYTVR